MKELTTHYLYKLKNIPVGDWSVSLLEEAVNSEEMIRGLTGEDPSVKTQDKRKQRMGEFLQVFDTAIHSCPGSFAEMIVSGVESRLSNDAKANGGGEASLHHLVESTWGEPERLNSKLSSLLKKCPKNLIPLVGDFLTSRHAMTNRVHTEGVGNTTPEIIREKISAMMVASVAHCGGILSKQNLGWASELAKAAEKTNSGVLGGLGSDDPAQQSKNRGVVYKHRRQYGSLNTEKILLAEGVPYRQGTTEMSPSLGLNLELYEEKLSQKLPSYLVQRKKTYIDPKIVERVSRITARGGVVTHCPVVSPSKVELFEVSVQTKRKSSKIQSEKILKQESSPHWETGADQKEHSPRHPRLLLAEILGRGKVKLSEKLIEVSAVLGGKYKNELEAEIAKELVRVSPSRLDYEPGDKKFAPQILQVLGDLTGGERDIIPHLGLVEACSGFVSSARAREEAVFSVSHSPHFSSGVGEEGRARIQDALPMSMGLGDFPAYPVAGTGEELRKWRQLVADNVRTEFVRSVSTRAGPITMRVPKEVLLKAADELDQAWRRKDSAERQALEVYAVVACQTKPSQWRVEDGHEPQSRSLSMGQKRAAAGFFAGQTVSR